MIFQIGSRGNFGSIIGSVTILRKDQFIYVTSDKSGKDIKVSANFYMGPVPQFNVDPKFKKRDREAIFFSNALLFKLKLTTLYVSPFGTNKRRTKSSIVKFTDTELMNMCEFANLTQERLASVKLLFLQCS